MSEAVDEALVLYDGHCGLCDRSVQWLLRLDSEGRLRFAPLQGETAAAVLARHPHVPCDVDSILFVERDGEGEHISWRSEAIVRIARHLPDPPVGLRLLALFPRPIADLGYRLVAALRYRIWGRFPTCRLASPDERARFLP